MVAASSESPGEAHRRERRLFYREVLDAADPDFTQALQLYLRAFPPEERMPRRDIAAALEDRRRGAMTADNFRLVVCREGERVLGMCTGRFLSDVNIGFVGYLVVDPSQRRRKIGSSLRRHLIEGFRRDSNLAGHEDLEAAMGEVELDNPWISMLVGKRKVLALNIDYFQPSVRPGCSPVPLVLYYQPVGATPLPAALPSEKVAAILRSIYRSVYHIDDIEGCEVLIHMLRAFAGRAEVGPRDLRAARRKAPGSRNA